MSTSILLVVCVRDSEVHVQVIFFSLQPATKMLLFFCITEIYKNIFGKCKMKCKFYLALM